MRPVLVLCGAVPLAIPFALLSRVGETWRTTCSALGDPGSRKRTTSLRFSALFSSCPPWAAPDCAARQASCLTHIGLSEVGTDKLPARLNPITLQGLNFLFLAPRSWIKLTNYGVCT
jgi:hypothetical protein